MNNFPYWVDNELLPAIYENADKLFPQLQFTLVRGKGWQSPKKIDGSDPILIRKDKTIFYPNPNYEYCIIEQGGDRKNCITLYQELNNYPRTREGRIAAILAIAEALNIDKPESSQEDREKYTAYASKQDKIREELSKMQEELHKAGVGQQVYNYLTQVRGFSTEFIEWAGFGAITEAEASILGDIMKVKQQDGTFKPAVTGYTAKTHPLAIPCIERGRIYGFTFRWIEEPAEGSREAKDSKYHNTAGMRKGENLAGLTRINLTKDTKRAKDLIIVEGNFDYLMLQYKGFNAVASQGGAPNKEALAKAWRMGFRRLTLLFDHDEAGIRFTEETIKTARGLGFSVFVSKLPAGFKDPCEYMLTHSVEDMEQIIYSADRGAHYLCADEIRAFVEAHTEKAASWQEEAELQATVIEIANTYSYNEVERDCIFAEYSEAFEETKITAESLRKVADRQRAANALREQEALTKEIVNEAAKLTSEGKFKEALALLSSRRMAEINDKSKQSQFAELSKPTTREEYIKAVKEEGNPLQTSYIFGRGGYTPKQLTIPMGALTYIAAPTSHGKSIMLRNLALDILLNDPADGDILYFTMEESKEDVLTQFVNTYWGRLLHAPSREHEQTETIKAYYKGVSKYIDIEYKSQFAAKEKEFFTKYIETGKLKPYYSSLQAEKFISFLQYLIDSSSTTIKAIFIDYVQLMSRENNKAARSEELKSICLMLKDFSVNYKLPIILGSQVTRETSSPMRLNNQALAESSDIEKAANTIVCLWNSKEKPQYGKNSLEKDERERLEELTKETGFEMGKAGLIYATITKRRGGSSKLYEVFKVNEVVGKIYPVGTSPEEKEAKAEEERKRMDDEDDEEYISILQKPKPAKPQQEQPANKLPDLPTAADYEASASEQEDGTEELPF